MVHIEELAEAALAGDALRLRSLAHDWLRENPRIFDVAPPESSNPTIRVISAALVELLADRSHQPPPGWVHGIGSAESPLYLLKSAVTMPRLRKLCETESPWPLRRRNLFAPPTFLDFA
jgi:hypothetical protein